MSWNPGTGALLQEWGWKFRPRYGHWPSGDEKCFGVAVAEVLSCTSGLIIF